MNSFADFSLLMTVTLLHFFWLGAVVGLASATLGAVLRGSSSTGRYTGQRACLAVLVICLPLATWLAALSIGQHSLAHGGYPAMKSGKSAGIDPVVTQKEERGASAQNGSAITDFEATPIEDTGSSPVGFRGPPLQEATVTGSPDLSSVPEAVWVLLVRFAPLVTIAWVAGIGFMLARLVLMIAGCERLIRTAGPVSDPLIQQMFKDLVRRMEMKTGPALKLSFQVAAPVVAGIVRPVILLPGCMMTGLTVADLNLLLTHELVHIRRHDHWWVYLQRFAEAVLFFHPATWYIGRRLQEERELSCDECVVKLGYTELDYARTLCRVAELGMTARDEHLAVGATGKSAGELLQRIRRLLGEEHPRSPTFLGATAFPVAIAMALCLVGGVAFLVRDSGSKDPQQEEQAKTRTITFPPDRSMGMLYAGPSVESGPDITWNVDFQEIGPATGSVSVPANALIRLDVSLDACRDLSPLGTLNPDDLHGVFFNLESSVHDQLQHIAHLAALRIIHLSCPFNDDDIRHLASLKNLEIVYCSAYGHSDKGWGITDAGLATFEDMSKLRNLYLRTCPVTDSGLERLSQCISLERLSLDDSRVNGSGLDSLMMLPNLKHLSFGSYNEGSPVDDEGLKTICQLTALESLGLAGTKITDEGLVHLQSLENLKDLCLDNTKVTDEGLAGLVGLNQLEKLRFHRDRGAGLGDTAAKNLAKLPKLKEVTAHWQLSKEGIESIATMKNLTRFNFAGKVTDVEMELISGMSGLEELWLQNCPITDAGFSKIERLTNLASLHFHGLQLTPAGLETVSRLPNLKHMRGGFEHGSLARRPGEAWRALERMPNLELLGIAGLLIDDEQWSILEAMPNLTSLRVESEVPLRSGFFRAISQLRKLTSLDANWVSPGKADISKLAELPDLEYVSMTGDIGDLELNQLAKVPRLRSVQLSTSYPLSGSEEAMFAKQSKSIQSFRLTSLGYTNPHVVSKDGALLWMPESKDEVELMTGNTAPPITVDRALSIPRGFEPDLTRLRGSPVLIYFWWALPPTIIEADGHAIAVAEVEKKFRDRGLKVFGIHWTHDSQNMRARIDEMKIQWPVAVDVEDKTATAWHASGRSAVYLLDGEGKVRMAQVYLGDLERAVEVLLKEHEASQADGNR